MPNQTRNLDRRTTCTQDSVRYGETAELRQICRRKGFRVNLMLSSSDRSIMENSILVVALLVCFSITCSDASAGDRDPLYRTCVDQCEKTGCFEDKCFNSCEIKASSIPLEDDKLLKMPSFLKWEEWDCRSECRYECMVKRESEKREKGEELVKYHGKWPFERKFGLQEPVSVAFSVLNLVFHLLGWLSFYDLVYHKLPLTPKSKKPYYDFTGLWNVYAFLSVNAWLWSATFHGRDLDFTEKLDYSSAVALLGYSLIVAILRTFNVRHEAARVMVAAPLLAFVTTHILFLNFYKFDYGLNMKVCISMAVIQLLLWAIWGGLTSHPARYKLWLVVFGGGLAMLLEIFDFPPLWGYLDAHALWHATTIPLTFFWWSFIKDDANQRTLKIINSFKDSKERKKAQ